MNRSITVGVSGMLGDIIYGCSALKALSESTASQIILYIWPNPKATRPVFDKARFDQIQPLLAIQPYIEAVIWHPDGRPAVEIDLNRFRDIWKRSFVAHRSIVSMMCEVVGVPDQTNIHMPWLTVDESCPLDNWPVLINVTPRYRNPDFPWGKVLKRYNGQIGFIGTHAERDEFCRSFNCRLTLMVTENCLHVTRLIAGCKLFIGNQSSAYAIAEGIKKAPLVQETWRANPNCLFFRPGVTHGWGADVELPDL